MRPRSPRFSPDTRRVVEILVYPAVQLLDVTGPLQVFSSANDHLIREGRTRAYDIRLVAPRGRRVEASAGIALEAQPLSEPDAVVDTLLVAGGEGIHTASGDGELLDWLRQRARKARRTASICTGAFLLGASGLLDGRRVATHWRFCAELARRFPTVRVVPEPIFVRDGPIWTSAGVTAGIDLALALVEEDLGLKVALAVARYLVVFLKRPGDQAQYSEALSLQTADDRFGALHGWIGQHLAHDLSLPALAARAGMSQRSFSRHYREQTGLTPARAIERLRVEGARRLLLDTSLPAKRVAQRCGFGSEETMRRSFIRLLQSTPQEYRGRFSG